MGIIKQAVPGGFSGICYGICFPPPSRVRMRSTPGGRRANVALLYRQLAALMQAAWKSFHNPVAAGNQFINLALRW